MLLPPIATFLANVWACTSLYMIWGPKPLHSTSQPCSVLHLREHLPSHGENNGRKTNTIGFLDSRRWIFHSKISLPRLPEVTDYAPFPPALAVMKVKVLMVNQPHFVQKHML